MAHRENDERTLAAAEYAASDGYATEDQKRMIQRVYLWKHNQKVVVKEKPRNKHTKKYHNY